MVLIKIVSEVCFIIIIFNHKFLIKIVSELCFIILINGWGGGGVQNGYHLRFCSAAFDHLRDMRMFHVYYMK